MAFDLDRAMELLPAPRAVFDALPERAGRPRFHVPDGAGGWTAVTWQQFADDIRRAACYLREVGVGSGDRVAIYAPNSVAWAAAALAIQSIGGIMVPIYPSCTADQAGYILDHSDAKLVFADTPALVERLGGRRRVVYLGDGAPDGTTPWAKALELGGTVDPAAFDTMLRAVELDQPGLMLYTSGTTGNPKGVPLTHRNAAVNGRDWLECNAPLLRDDEVDVLWLPMSHIFGFGEMCLGNTLGYTTYMSDPVNVLPLLPTLKPTVFMSVPAYWKKLAAPALAADDPSQIAETTGGRLRFCLSGGAGLDREVKEMFHRAGVLIVEGYGLTECSPTLTLNRPDAFRFDSVGKPLPSVELRLADDGEILARGPNVFSGYHKDPDATRAAFTDDGWFKTGDVGRFTEDGFLQIVDRKKDILVTAGGKNIPPANIELELLHDPAFQHAVVYGDGKSYLVAALWLAPGVPLDRAAIQKKLDAINARLARHETIKRFCVIDTPLTPDNGLLTASLKVRRKQVYQAFRDRFEALYD